MCSPSGSLGSIFGQSSSQANQAIKARHSYQGYQQNAAQALENRDFAKQTASQDHSEVVRSLGLSADKGRKQSKRNHGARKAKGAASGLTNSGSRLDTLFDAKHREEKSILDTLNEGRRKANLRKQRSFDTADRSYRQRKDRLDLGINQDMEGFQQSNFNSIFG